MNRQTDHVTALVIQAVINLSVSYGLSRAARMLAQDNVPVEVASANPAKPIAQIGVRLRKRGHAHVKTRVSSLIRANATIANEVAPSSSEASKKILNLALAR